MHHLYFVYYSPSKPPLSEQPDPVNERRNRSVILPHAIDNDARSALPVLGRPLYDRPFASNDSLS